MLKMLAATAAAAAVLVPAAMAADPGSALTADLQKLTADRGTMHAAVMSDIQKITADAQAKSGSSLGAALKGDIAKLEADVSGNHVILQADRQQGLSDYAAAKAAHVKPSELTSQLKQLLDLWQQDAKDLQEDAQAAQQAIAAAEAHVHS